jgi:hypothetical protein
LALADAAGAGSVFAGPAEREVAFDDGTKRGMI